VVRRRGAVGDAGQRGDEEELRGVRRQAEGGVAGGAQQLQPDEDAPPRLQPPRVGLGRQDRDAAEALFG
jgi:hypothetical protein